MKDEYDLSKMKRRHPVKVDPDAVMIPINIRIHANDVCAIRDEADRLGVPYLNLIENILHQYANDIVKEDKK
jgi:predicted DNA binding CopG/RHH family protein